MLCDKGHRSTTNLAMHMHCKTMHRIALHANIHVHVHVCLYVCTHPLRPPKAMQPSTMGVRRHRSTRQLPCSCDAVRGCGVAVMKITDRPISTTMPRE
jgi:hypothetical protein